MNCITYRITYNDPELGDEYAEICLLEEHHGGRHDWDEVSV
jgi:hypothetical protein